MESNRRIQTLRTHTRIQTVSVESDNSMKMELVKSDDKVWNATADRIKNNRKEILKNTRMSQQKF